MIEQNMAVKQAVEKYIFDIVDSGNHWIAGRKIMGRRGMEYTNCSPV